MPTCELTRFESTLGSAKLDIPARGAPDSNAALEVLS